MLYRKASSADEHCSCEPLAKKPRPGRLSWLLGAAVAILPKCPFCAFGYSSVMTLCSGKSLHYYEPNTLNWLPVLIAVLTMGVISWNYKGRRTLAALAIAAGGTGLIYYAEYFTGNTTEYYFGAVLLLAAVFANGSFLHYWKKFTLFIQPTKTT